MKLLLPEAGAKFAAGSPREQKKHKRDLRRYSRLLPFLLFLLVSALLWFIMVLQSTHSAHLSVPLTFTQMPAGYFPERELPGRFEVSVSAKGWDLLGSALSRVDTLTIPFSANQSASATDELLLSPTLITEYLQEYLGKGYRISSVYPDQIRIPMAQMQSKVVPVVPQVRIEPRRGFTTLAPQVDPAQVTLYSTASILEQWDQVTVGDSLLLTGVAENVSRTLPLLLPGTVKADPPQVKLQVQVEELTEHSVELPILSRGNPEGVVVRLLPSHATLKMVLPLSRYNELQRLRPQLWVDYARIAQADSTAEELRYLTVFVDGLPDWVVRTSVNPVHVGFVRESSPVLAP